MKKVVNVNLSGNAYQLEEDGFDRLNAYLEGARASLAGNPDLEEVMSDLEQSVADKINRFLGRNKTVVTTGEIEAIVDEMGPVEAETGFDDSGLRDRRADAGAARERPESGVRDDDPERHEDTQRRKLFRITSDDDKMLAGVCAGLAAYFGLDVTIVRIAFLALILATSGLAVLAYVALAIVIPAAATPEQVARAYGVPFDARGVIDRARSRFDDVQQGRRSKSQPRYRSRPASGAGSDGIGSLLGLLVVLLAILVGLWLSSKILFWFGSPLRVGTFGMGPVYYGVWPWWMTVLMVIAGVLVIAWIFGDRGGDQRSGLGSLLVRTLQVFLILFILYWAYRMLPFVHEPVNALIHMASGVRF